MQRPGAASASAAAVPAAQGAGGTGPTAASGGPCLLALPAADAADVGVWQLGQQGSSSSRPSVLLKQQRSQERPRHGLCMAVALVQPQGSTLHAVAGYEDGSVALWDVRRPNQPLASAKLHSEAIMCVAVAPDCTSGFSGSADKHVSAFKLSIPRGQLRPSVQAALPEPGVADVAVRGDGRIVASAGWDGRVRVWHARKWLPLAVLRWHSQQVACVQFSADGRLLAAGGRDNHISIWSIYAEAP
ncbi:WD40-repeat-containing domain protein [Scenedesmus sp. NREL 46B-D3]|nr:WD40-repeat-containing domain protein [Scenedesmus sp. NREL 46B-D3]